MPATTDTTGLGHLGDAALTYASHGVHIFPCQPAGKQPLPGLRWADQATCDLDQVADWWHANPQANIAIPLGPNRLFVIDVDGPDGRAHLDRLVTEHGPLPDTYRVRTGRAEGDGHHIVFRQPADGPSVRNRKIAGNPKLETRGDGGYVIAPPSLHESGRTYMALGNWSQIADPPDWLLDLVRDPPPNTNPLPQVETPGDVQQRRLDALAGKVAMGQEGNRNDLLNWAAYQAGRAVGAGLVDRDEAERRLLVAAARAGLGEAESRATVTSGLDAGTNDPEPAQAANPWQPDNIPTVTVLDDSPPVLEDQPDTVVGLVADLPLDPARLDPGNPLHAAALGEYVRLVGRRHAQLIDVAQTSPPVPELIRLTDLLAQPDPPITYRLDALWPTHGRVMLAAQFKAGKSTLVGNLVRSLVDNEPFLGRHTPAELAGRVVVVDDELHVDTLRRWYREHNIVNTGKVDVVPLRGAVTTFNILDPHVRQAWADRIRASGADVLIFDCLRPVLDALGLSEDKDAGRFLVALDELLAAADVTEALVVHHMGHDAERSRGDSRLRDWPDVEWRLIRDAEHNDDPAAPRYFTAYGRDVDVTESRIDYDPDTRRLTVVGGSRKDEKVVGELLSVCTAVEQNPGASFNRVRQAIGWGGPKTRRVLDEAVARELVEDRSPDESGPEWWHRTDKGIR